MKTASELTDWNRGYVFFDFSYNNNCSPKLLYTILYSEFDEIGILNRMGKEVFKVN